MTRVILSTPSLAGRTATIIGRIIAPVIEESETYLVKYTTIANPKNVTSTAFGARNKNTPRLVATPFHLWNLKSMTLSVQI